MSLVNDPFHSERLCYRAIDSKDDLPFYVALNSDPEAQVSPPLNACQSSMSTRADMDSVDGSEP